MCLVTSVSDAGECDEKGTCHGPDEPGQRDAGSGRSRGGPAGGFRQGGWSVTYWDDTTANAMGDVFGQPYELLLGRKTYDIFAGYWAGKQSQVLQTQSARLQYHQCQTGDWREQRDRAPHFPTQC